MIHELPAGVARTALAAIETVVRADGRLDAHEASLLGAVARALGVDEARETPEPVTPETVAGAITDPSHRERLVQAMLVAALIDGEITAAERALVEDYAAALGVDEPRLHSLQRIMDGELRCLQFDILRRSPMVSDVIRHAWETRGLGGAWKTLAPLLPGRSLAQDAALAQRYLDLGALPAGTFGREYFDHMRARGFTLPGQAGGFPEGFIKHDLCHVLGGYDTDPCGECEVGAFIAGFLKRDPFGYLFMLLLHLHLGINIFEGDATGTFGFDPDRVLAALERGLRVNRDLYAVDFDWWPHFPRPLAEVRADFGIA